VIASWSWLAVLALEVAVIAGIIYLGNRSQRKEPQP
jgi:hypothetical protein